MGIFNLFKKEKTIPEWADFFTHKEYKEFIKCVKNHFENKLTIDEKEGTVKVTGNETIFGLLNVAHYCNENDISNYPKIIENHFDTLISSQKFSEEFSKNENDFDKVRQYIAVKIYPLEYLERVGFEKVIYEKITDDIFKTLVYDFPHTINTIKNEQLTVWDKTKEELFKIGSLNLKDKYEREISHTDMGDFKLWLIADNEGLSTNIIVDNEELQKYLGNQGALIGIPNGNLTIIYPINTLEVINAVHTVAKIIEGEFDKPKAIIDKLYWYNKEKLIEIPFDITDDKITITPPQIFVDVLNNLPEK